MSRELNRFHKYLNLYQKMVKKNAGRFVDEKLAEDISQETFLRMYMCIDFMKDEEVKPWLLVVSSNLAKDSLKKGGKVEVHSVDPMEMANYENEFSESAEEGFEREEKAKAVHALKLTAYELLHDKNPKWYYIIHEYYEMGKSSAEIAKELNTTAGNVDVMKVRAKMYLRKNLGNQYREIF